MFEDRMPKDRGGNYPMEVPFIAWNELKTGKLDLKRCNQTNIDFPVNRIVTQINETISEFFEAGAFLFLSDFDPNLKWHLIKRGRMFIKRVKKLQDSSLYVFDSMEMEVYPRNEIEIIASISAMYKTWEGF